MILICSLIGKDKKFFFGKNFFFNQFKNINYIDYLIKNYSFCKKIYLITEKKIPNYLTNKISNKLKNIVIKKSKNQCHTLFSLQKIIPDFEKVIILNSDSIIKMGSYFFKNNINKDIILGTIKNEDVRRNFNKKDTFIIDKKSNYIKKINIKSCLIDNKNIISAGVYYFKRWDYFLSIYKKSNTILKKEKNLIICKLLKNFLKEYKFGYSYIKNFACFENEKKIHEYIFWKKYFHKNKLIIDNLNKLPIQNIIPAAGEGSRHKHLGFNLPKPLIKISKKTMYEKSVEALPNKKNLLLIFKKNTFLKYKLDKKLNKNIKYFLISKKTDGMARTIYKAKKYIDLDKPIIVSSCDIKFVINYKKLYKIINKFSPDGIIFTWKNYPFANESPNSHAYAKVNKKNYNVINIVEKEPISKNPNNDHAVTGIFYFKNGAILLNCIENMFQKKITVNGEYYIATAMNKLITDKKIVKVFLVDQFISWSLPEHLLDYLYWERIINDKN